MLEKRYTMDQNKVEAAFNAIVAKRNELSVLDYSDESYDDLEDQLHELEDDFMENYGEFVEDIIDDVHAELKIDSDVLSPVSYILPSYEAVGKKDVDIEDGVFVEVEGFSDVNSRLMILPEPMRIVFAIGGQITKEWNLF